MKNLGEWGDILTTDQGGKKCTLGGCGSERYRKRLQTVCSPRWRRRSRKGSEVPKLIR